ncbi:serine/threonine protein kinase [Trichophyton rubrum]|uniref:EKC/KEOPS complex subunit BUD32 n=2 Tax=Trichophyton rubrum TaxID=5551 RepID=A0A178EWL7_TRIRU|nr:serine/threonine protein kinase [Trichophyton rubrum]
MIDSRRRFHFSNGIDDLVDMKWNVIDWDTRRWLQLVGPSELLGGDDIEAYRHIAARFADRLGLDQHTIVVDKNGALEKFTREDVTMEVRYPKYTGPMEKDQVIRRSELTELDRINACADLVEYNSSDGLQGNDLFVPFHRIVIDDVNETILGFTSIYMSGGTLKDYRGTFYFRWLKQITDAIDQLNLRYGILHQDLAPRNILIDPTTHDLKVFDFDMSAKMDGQNGLTTSIDVNSVIITVYEALTGDEKYLSEWAAVRRTTKTIKHFSEATEPLSIPEYPKLVPYQPRNEFRNFDVYTRSRAVAEEAGDYVTRWERPAQHELTTSN